MKLTIILSSMFFACSLHAQSVASLQAEIVALRQQVAALQPLAALAPFVTVDLSAQNGTPAPIIVFHGANVQIVNGTGQTNVTNGLGNLIIGMNEQDPTIPFQSTQRMGSHNLVVGRYHHWMGTAFGDILGGSGNWAVGEGGLIAGYENQISGQDATIIGGSNSLAAGQYSVILGERSVETKGQYQINPVP